MVQLTLFPDHPTGPRWIAPPWTTASERWLELDRQLPPEDPARQIAAVVAELDLTALERSYAGLGSPAYPPALLLRLVLFEEQSGRLSPAQWYQDCRRDAAVQWLLLGLRPSRSALYAFRDRVGPYQDAWNRQILQAAQAEGWTPAQRVSFDGTFAAAYASRHTPVHAKTLTQRCQQLDAALAADFAATTGTPAQPPPAVEAAATSAQDRLRAGSTPEPDPAPEPAPAAGPTSSAGAATPVPAPVPAPSAPARPSWMAQTPAGRFGQRQRYRRAQAQMARRQQHRRRTMSRQGKAKRRSPERIKVSPSEPEAVLGRDKTKVFRPLYNIQLACDLDSDFVLGSGVFAAAGDAALFGPLLGRTRDLSGRMPAVVVNDKTYASILNLKLCSDREITMYAPVSADPPPELTSPAAGASAGAVAAPTDRPVPPEKSPRQIPKAAFTWLPEQQTYRCPAGHLLVLQRRGTDPRADGELKQAQYRCPAEHCQVCPLRDRCTRSPQRGRIIKRSEHDELYEALRQRMRQDQGQAIYKLRKQTVERQIADLKEHRGLRRFRSFGLERARIQVGLLVLAHNGLALLKARGQRAGTATPALTAGPE
jgi:transposase